LQEHIVFAAGETKRNIVVLKRAVFLLAVSIGPLPPGVTNFIATGMYSIAQQIPHCAYLTNTD
jgi:hypothetical protein